MRKDYKTDSLGHLEAWITDALNSSASSKEVYDTIVNTIKEEIEYHERYLKRSKDLLLMIKGNLSAISDAEDFWSGNISDERFEEVLNREGYEYTPPIPQRY